MLFSCRKYYKLVMVCEENSLKFQLIYIRVVIYYINQDAMSPGCLLPSFQFTYILYNVYFWRSKLLISETRQNTDVLCIVQGTT